MGIIDTTFSGRRTAQLAPAVTDHTDAEWEAMGRAMAEAPHSPQFIFDQACNEIAKTVTAACIRTGGPIEVDIYIAPGGIPQAADGAYDGNGPYVTMICDAAPYIAAGKTERFAKFRIEGRIRAAAIEMINL